MVSTHLKFPHFLSSPGTPLIGAAPAKSEFRGKPNAEDRQTQSSTLNCGSSSGRLGSSGACVWLWTQLHKTRVQSSLFFQTQRVHRPVQFSVQSQASSCFVGSFPHQRVAWKVWPEVRVGREKHGGHLALTCFCHCDMIHPSTTLPRPVSIPNRLCHTRISGKSFARTFQLPFKASNHYEKEINTADHVLQ